jgi:class 3 adenylate cyclase/DNA-binding CsgD family transcriptional regulator
VDPVGTVTFLFTDVVRSTSALTSLGRERYADLLEGQRRAIEEAVARAEGAVVDHAGDGILAAFESAAAALAAAVAAQRALAAEGDHGLAVRMGLDSGDVLLRGDTYVGTPLHRGARICALAGGGTILLSQATHELVGGDLPEGVELVALGAVFLEGFAVAARVHQAVVADVSASAAPLRAVHVQGPLLLERDDELGRLEEHVARVGRGLGGVLALEGAAGIGKTSLLEAARTRALERGMSVLSARATDLEVDYPFGLVRQLFELAVARADDADVLFEGAASGARSIADRSSSDTIGDGFAILHSLYWLTVNLAQREPLLVAIDDLQWSDPQSLRFLAYLAPRIADLPIGLLVTVRTGEAPSDERAFATMLTDPATARITPRGLSEAAVGEMLRRTLTTDPDAAFVSACAEATAANPLLVHELAGALAAAGVRPTAESIDAIPALGPEAVSRFALRRLERLGPSARQLADAVAVLGDDCTLRSAAMLAELERPPAADAAASLARADLLAPGSTLRFVHPLVRAAVYEAIDPSERGLAHLRAAEACAAEGEDALRVGLHLLQAPPGGEDAVAGLRDAARSASRDGAPSTAASFLLRLLEEPLARDLRGEILLELGSAELRFDAHAAARHLAEAAGLADDPEQRAEISLYTGRALYAGGEYDESIAVLDNALATLSDPESDLANRLEAELIAPLSENLFEERILEILERAATRTLRPGLGRRMLIASLASGLELGLSREEYVRLALESVTDDVLLQDETSDAYLWATRALYAADEFDPALAALDRAVDHARRRGSVHLLVGGLHFRARVRRLLGDLADAEVDARAALAALELHDVPMSLPYLAAVLADVLAARGEHDEARAAISLAPPLAAARQPTMVLLTRAELALAADRPNEALSPLDEIDSRFTARFAGGRRWLTLKAEALVALGRPAEAADIAAAEVEHARRWGAPRAVSQALRAAAGATDDTAHRLELLREAADVIDGSPAKLERAQVLGAYGSAMRRSGKRAEARDVLRQALELAHLSGAAALESTIREEIHATGGRPRRTALTGLDALTPSEQRVARLAAAGRTNREIAEELFVTLKTVEMHLASGYRKLGIGSRTQLPAALAPD